MCVFLFFVFYGMEKYVVGNDEVLFWDFFSIFRLD